MSRMRRFAWLSRQRNVGNKKSARKDRGLRFEPLEDRRLLAMLTVNSALDNVTFGDGLVTLREAIVAANNNSPTVTDLGETGDIGPDTIVFDPAVFSSPQTILLSLNDDIEIKEALTINGPGQELLTIDAQLNSRIFDITATTGDFTIAGLTLTDGLVLYNPTHPVSQSRGGAIRSLTNGSLTIALSTIKDSSTSGNLNDDTGLGAGHGGGIYSVGRLTLIQSTVSENSTSFPNALGGGIYSLSHLTLIQSTISGNTTEGAGADGGGINVRGQLELFGSTVTDNHISAGSDGGGIYAFGNVLLSQSTVSGNSTAGTGGQGGGVFARGNVVLSLSTVSGNSTSGDYGKGGGVYALGAVTLTDSTVSGNSTARSAVEIIGVNAGARGGGIYAYGEVTLTSSTVSGNSTLRSGNKNVGSYGGGISSYANVTLTDSTVSGNSARAGGGIRTRGTVTLTRSTVSGNTATTENGDGNGGGIFSKESMTLTQSTITDNHGSGVFLDGSSSIVIAGSIVAGNTKDGVIDDISHAAAVTPEVNFSLIEETGLTIIGGENIIGMPANLGPLANNGGPTLTHALLASSPAIDAGSPFVTSDPMEYDQRGAPFVRVFDGGVNGLRIDMGAYERQTLPASFLVVDTPLDGDDGVYIAGFLSLREVVHLTEGSIGADTITFDPVVFATPQTMLLTLGDMEISEAVVIEGPGQHLLSIDAQQQSRIFDITATTGNFTLSGMTLTGGQTIVDGIPGAGGAIRSLTSGILTIDQSTIVGNSTMGESANGGGLFSSGNVTATGSTVSENSTTGDFAHSGGIRATGHLTLTDSTVSNNSTSGIGASGGGVFAFSASLTGSTVSGNSTAGDSADGGGIYSFGDVTLLGSTISGNSTAGELSDGGGLFSSGNVTATGSTVSENSTTGDFARSGGIRATGAVSLTQSTVSGNSTAGSSAYGGGISSSGIITITHSTVSGNSAASLNAEGGGISNDNDLIMIANSIVAGNTAGGGMNDIRPGSGTLDVNFSLIQQTGLTITGGDNIIGQSAKLGPLANNGGPTWTHALAANSPALDAGDPSILFDANEFDQRGAPFIRVFDGNAVVGARIDIGAYERQTVAGLNLVVNTPIDESDGNYSAGNLSLREAVGLANGSIGDDTITFDAAVFDMPQTMLLSLGEFGISEVVSIDGPGQAVLTIDGQQQSRIFNITATTGDFTLSGLTLTGGRTVVDSISSVGLGSGGAVRSLTIGNLTIDQSTISGNSTEGNYGRGGGIFSTRNLTLTDSTVSNNSTSGIGASGGGVFAFSASLTGSTVSGNSTAGTNSASNGGGIYSVRDTALNQSRVSGNSSSNRGGGIYSFDGSITLTDSTVSGNSAASRGGGIESKRSVTLNNSTLSGNVAIAPGGGIYARVDVTLTNSTVSGNRTTGGYAVGGGIAVFRNLTITNSTVSGNSTAMLNASGGGIWHDSGAFAITNSIVAGNTATGGMNDIRQGGGSFDVNFSLIEQIGLTFIGGDNIIGMPANLGLLANNGGPTQTHALLVGSPALDAGDPAAMAGVGDTPLFEQRGAGFDRVVNGRIDIGAFELQLSEVDTDADGVSDEVEDSAPNGGDGNQDGIPDSQQENVTSLPNSVTQEFVTLVAPVGVTLKNISTTDNPAPSTAPDFAYPYGFFEFELSGVTAGEATTVELLLPTGASPPSTYFKFGPEPGNPAPHWYEFLFDGTTGAQILSDRVVLHFVDGSRGDADLTANGTITDPGAPALEPPELPGDYNLDNRVNLADYTVWRNNLGATVANYNGADGDGSGVVDVADYQVWRSHFGEILVAPVLAISSNAESESSSLESNPAGSSSQSLLCTPISSSNADEPAKDRSTASNSGFVGGARHADTPFAQGQSAPFASPKSETPVGQRKFAGDNSILDSHEQALLLLLGTRYQQNARADDIDVLDEAFTTSYEEEKQIDEDSGIEILLWAIDE